MPIFVDSSEFINDFTGNTAFYKSNTGDEISVELNIRGNIRMTSAGNPLTLDPTVNQVTSAGTSWLDSGFRPNQWLYCVRYTSGGAVIGSPFWTFVSYVDDTLIDLSSIPQWYSIGNSEYMTLTAVVAQNSTSALPFDEVKIKFNQVLNQTPGSEFSLIDAEATIAVCPGVAALGNGGISNGIILGNESGTFLKSAEVERVPGVDQFYKYKVRLVFVNQGMYNDSWFFSSDCLKAWISTQWAVVSGEPYNPITGNYSLDADTGYYDEGYNASAIINSTLLQGITEVDYCLPTTTDIIVDGPVTGLGIGSCYLSVDETYFRNRPDSQYKLTMIIPTTPLVLGVLNSEVNEFNAAYDLEVNSINSVGTITTINITITPNLDFQNFIESRDPLDRNFQVWVRCGDVNLLVYDNQLECAPPVGGPLLMEQSYAFLDHSENVNDIVGDFVGFECNTEDDIGYVGRFLLDKDIIHQSFTVSIEAFNTVTNDDFTLQSAFFGFNNVQISNDGRYLLNEVVVINNTLPTTSEKLEAILVLDPSLDTPTQYGVKIYAPWLMNWKYWLPQLNASVDFYPNQDENWVVYDDLIADWTVQMKLELVREGLAYIHTENIEIKDYDSEPFIAQDIQLFVDSTSQNVQIVTEGLLMRVVATHVLNNGQAWNPSTTWGMITVEPYEAERRFICSTVVDFDNDSNNPLYPLSTLLMAITYPAPNVARMECYFNPDLINLTNGCKFTTKIKDLCPGGQVLTKTETDGTIKTTTYSTDKTLAIP